MNLNESPSRELAVGHIKGQWRDLGREAGSRTIGLRRIEVARRIGKEAGAVRSGLNHAVLSAEQQGAPAHCHSVEEELFVLLEGEGVLELWGRGQESPDERPLRAGDVVSRPAGTGIAHAIRPGAQGMIYLAYGTRETSDMCFYPQSGRVSLRGLGIALSSPEIEHLPSI